MKLATKLVYGTLGTLSLLLGLATAEYVNGHRHLLSPILNTIPSSLSA